MENLIIIKQKIKNKNNSRLAWFYFIFGGIILSLLIISKIPFVSDRNLPSSAIIFHFVILVLSFLTCIYIIYKGFVILFTKEIIKQNTKNGSVVIERNLKNYTFQNTDINNLTSIIKINSLKEVKNIESLLFFDYFKKRFKTKKEIVVNTLSSTLFSLHNKDYINIWGAIVSNYDVSLYSNQSVKEVLFYLLNEEKTSQYQINQLESLILNSLSKNKYYDHCIYDYLKAPFSFDSVDLFNNITTENTYDFYYDLLSKNLLEIDLNNNFYQDQKELLITYAEWFKLYPSISILLNNNTKLYFENASSNKIKLPLFGKVTVKDLRVYFFSILFLSYLIIQLGKPILYAYNSKKYLNQFETPNQELKESIDGAVFKTKKAYTDYGIKTKIQNTLYIMKNDLLSIFNKSRVDDLKYWLKDNEKGVVNQFDNKINQLEQALKSEDALLRGLGLDILVEKESLSEKEIDLLLFGLDDVEPKNKKKSAKKLSSIKNFQGLEGYVQEKIKNKLKIENSSQIKDYYGKILNNTRK